LGTAPARRNPYTDHVQLKYSNTMFSTLWVAIVGGLGIIGQSRSVGSWMFLAGLAALPFLFTLFWLNGPAESLSQIIQKARR
jgi:hypothetical protein